jgi:hypothetical protein
MSTAQSLRLFASSGVILSFAAAADASGLGGEWGAAKNAQAYHSAIRRADVDTRRSIFMIFLLEPLVIHQ